jgi:3-deoxy-D-manno-octulosonic-acid transferase
LVPVGGHNLLEPAAWGKPVLFGPYTDHCAEVADLLTAAGGGVRVHDTHDLAVQATGLLQDESRRAAMGEAARRVVQENQGALEKSLDEIADFLPREGFSSAEAADALSLKLSSSGV